MNKRLQKYIDRGSLPLHVDAARCVKKAVQRKLRDFTWVDFIKGLLTFSTVAAAPIGCELAVLNHENIMAEQAKLSRYEIRLESICEQNGCNLYERYQHVDETVRATALNRDFEKGVELHKARHATKVQTND